MKLTEKQKIHFWDKIKKDEDGGCWLWLGGKFMQGYGMYHPKRGIQYGAHRVSYFLIKGFLPPRGMVLDHLCEQRLCVNPDHLNITTIYLNMIRGGRFHQKPLEKTPGWVYFHKTPNKRPWESGRRENGKPIYLGKWKTREEALASLQK